MSKTPKEFHVNTCRKKCYPTKLDAKLKLARMKNGKSGARKERRFYRCSRCGFYHLTSLPKGVKSHER